MADADRCETVWFEPHTPTKPELNPMAGECGSVWCLCLRCICLRGKQNRPLVLFLLVTSFAGLGASENGQFFCVTQGGETRVVTNLSDKFGVAGEKSISYRCRKQDFLKV